MRVQLLALVFVLSLFFAVDASSSTNTKKKIKRVRHMKTKTPVPAADVITAAETNNDVEDDVIKMLDADEEFQKAQELARENERAKEIANKPETEIIVQKDLCAKVHCGAGRTCEVNAENVPECVCIAECPVETEPRRKVCSKGNETWTSDCAVYQQRCWCDRGDPRCKGEEYKHIHIEYYGECREMPQCTEGEMADFPRRMRDWLFNIMRDLADRQELPEYYLEMEREAETNMTKRWTNAAVWKWCDLDGHPQDRSVSRHELFPIRAPLMSLEHCIAPFLDSCDSDDNHRISLHEWAKCLEIDPDEVEDRCEQIEVENSAKN